MSDNNNQIPEWQKPEIVTTKSSRACVNCVYIHNPDLDDEPCCSCGKFGKDNFKLEKHSPANDIPYPEEVKEIARQDILAKAEQSVKPETWEQMGDAVNDKIDEMISDRKQYTIDDKFLKKSCINCRHNEADDLDPCDICFDYNKHEFKDKNNCNDCEDCDYADERGPQAGIHANINAPLGGWRESDKSNRVSPYFHLQRILDMAIDQAENGKGKERHAEDNEPFERQVICEVAKRVGLGYTKGQAIKKIIESGRLDKPAAISELLGAINYIAATILVIETED